MQEAESYLRALTAPLAGAGREPAVGRAVQGVLCDEILVEEQASPKGPPGRLTATVTATFITRRATVTHDDT